METVLRIEGFSGKMYEFVQADIQDLPGISGIVAYVLIVPGITEILSFENTDDLSDIKRPDQRNKVFVFIDPIQDVENREMEFGDLMYLIPQNN